MLNSDGGTREILGKLASEGFSSSSFLRFLGKRYAGAFDRENKNVEIKIDDAKRFASAELLGVIKLASETVSRTPPALAVVLVSLAKETHLSERSSRKAQFELAKKTIDTFFYSPQKNSLLHTHKVRHGLFVFYDADGNFRLSLVISELSAGEDKIRWSSFRRQSFFVEKGANARTFVDRLSAPAGTLKIGTRSVPAGTLDEFKAAFSVEALTKEFYSELFAWFEWARNEKTGVTFPNLVSSPDDDRENIEIKIIRLITRIMFVWFIRKKDLVPAELFDINALSEILKDFSPNSIKSGNYYNAILQNLFFATLNSARIDEVGKKRSFAKLQGKTEPKNLYRYAELFKISEKKVIKLFDSVPFLNGGLFECLDKTKTLDGVKKAYYYDGFSRKKDRSAKNKHYKYRAFVPDALFFSKKDDTRGTPSGLFEIFDRYNFTIDENSPVDADVSLDPELLGRVFENLLAFVNPETGAQARKSSGSFYTPREIVGYMVDEALLAHVGEKCGKNVADTLRKIIEDEKPDDKIFPKPAERESFAKSVSAALKTVKILDPACGSGAFPMGCLSRIVDILEKIGSLDASNLDAVYSEKLNLVENCIYGVDIQPIAVQISKLRFFISLVCEAHRDDKKENFGIPTLPNLETKFVCADTLIPASLSKHESGDDWMNDPVLTEMKGELFDLRHRHFRAKTRKDKENLRKADENLRKKIYDYIVETAQKPDAEKIALCEKQIASDTREREKVAAKKIVRKEIPEERDLLGDVIRKKQVREIDVNADKRAELDKRIRDAKSVISDEKNKKLPKGFQEEVAQLATWNPYDQNAKAEFFEPEWMFGVKNGFDIIIGNPPYVQLQQGGLAAKYANAGYEVFAPTGDIYCLFYERGNALLHSGGYLAFITSNKWMRAGYGEKIRAFFSEKTSPRKLIDFAGTKIFESATVDTNILIFQKKYEKSAHKSELACRALTAKNLAGTDVIAEVFEKNSVAFTPPHSGTSWTILSPVEQSIKRKIEAAGTPLKDWDVSIYRGVLTGYNDAFIISTEKRAEILKNCADRAERSRTEKIIRPVLRGRDIKRYSAQWTNLWLIWIPWHFPLHLDETIQGASAAAERKFKTEYPAVYAHLSTFKKALALRNKAETGVRYEWYALQRWGAAYWEDFSKPKIVWARLCRISKSDVEDFPRFAKAEAGVFVLDSLCFFTGQDLERAVALLNSEFAAYYFFNNVAILDNGGMQMRQQYVENLPLPREKIDLNKNINKQVYEKFKFSKEEISFIKNFLQEKKDLIRGIPASDPEPTPPDVPAKPAPKKSGYDPSLDD